MKTKKMPAPKQGTERVNEFARLALELAVLNPQRMNEFGEEMRKQAASDRGVAKSFAFTEQND